MAQFQYVGRGKTGKQRKGKILSGSRREAIVALREKEIAVTEIHELPESLFTKEIFIGRPVKTKDFVIYLRQFSTLLQAGVSVVEATGILARQTESKALKKALFNVEEEVRAGNALSVAAMKQQRIFPPMFINLVQAGEVTGSLDETLDRLATYFEKQHHAAQKVKSALAYPIIIGLVAIGVVIFLLTSIVPTFAKLFNDFGAELPAITRFVLGVSAWLQTWWWLLLLLGLLIPLGLAFVQRNPSGRYYLHYLLLKLPVFGSLLQKAALARMSRTLSSLFSSSVPILQALTIVERIVENEVIARVLNASKESLHRGAALSEPMNRHWIFPPLVTNMIAIGEQSGSLDFMLSKIADFYEQEVETATDTLKSLIEPLMIIILAVIVGLIVTSIMVPMFELYNHVL